MNKCNMCVFNKRNNLYIFVHVIDVNYIIANIYILVSTFVERLF